MEKSSIKLSSVFHIYKKFKIKRNITKRTLDETYNIEDIPLSDCKNFIFAFLDNHGFYPNEINILINYYPSILVNIYGYFIEVKFHMIYIHYPINKIHIDE